MPATRPEPLTPSEQLATALSLVGRLIGMMDTEARQENIGGIGLGLLGLEASITRLQKDAKQTGPEQMH